MDVRTWETYTLAARKRVLSELGGPGLAGCCPPSGRHVAWAAGWPKEALDRLAAAVTERGGMAVEAAGGRAYAAGLGAFWHGIRALEAPSGPPGGRELAGRLRAALARDGGPGRSDMPCGPRVLPLGRRTAVMGILNVTPDSFSDGGRYMTPDAAVRRAREMVEQGADVIDVGGESTRPGAEPVPLDVELERVIPAVERIASEFAVPVSVDTCKAKVAERALGAGAHLINDISALRFDPGMARVVAERNVPVVLMHMRGTPRDMQVNPVYGSVVEEVLDFLDESIGKALSAGIGRDRILVDPGIGFGKTLDHNLEILRTLDALELLGCPILLGPSRKSFIGHILGLPPDRRVEGTAAAVALGIAAGASVVRVHDVAEMVRVARVADAIARGYRAARAFVGLGANVGEPLARLREALARLDRLPGTRVVRRSSVYRTEPVGPVAQPWFFNMVVEMQTDLDPVRLLAELLQIEAEMGRVRQTRWGPRVIDLDLLLYGDETVDRPGCQVPHPESHRRRFVLEPLAEIAPDVRWKGKPAVEHLAGLPASPAVERWGALE
ncbi:MAG: dihydropteroate synthase [Firmicutes bacterium]|nr:dihydropteroate synthase [Bacillota bacterium]